MIQNLPAAPGRVPHGSSSNRAALAQRVLPLSPGEGERERESTVSNSAVIIETCYKVLTSGRVCSHEAAMPRHTYILATVHSQCGQMKRTITVQDILQNKLDLSVIRVYHCKKKSVLLCNRKRRWGPSIFTRAVVWYVHSTVRNTLHICHIYFMFTSLFLNRSGQRKR